MKILILPSWYSNNSKPLSGIFFKEQALALKKYNKDISIVFFDCRPIKFLYNDLKSIFFYYSKGYEDNLFTFRRNGLNIFNYRSNFGKKIWIYLFFRTVEKYIKLYGKPDIIYCHSFMSGYVAKIIKSKYGINYVVTEHSSGFLDFKFNNYSVNLISEAYTGSSALVAVSSNLSKVIFDKFFINSVVIPNSISFELFKNEENIKTKNIVCISSLKKIKNLGFLIDSFFLSKVYEDGWTLTIIGSGEEYDFLRNLINSYHLDMSIFMLGSLDRNSIVDELSKSSFLCHTSTFETFGVVFIEAMAMGLPILTTPCGSVNDLLNINNGIVSNDFDTQNFSVNIRWMVNNFMNYNSILIRENAFKLYDNEIVAKNTLEILNFCFLND